MADIVQVVIGNVLRAGASGTLVIDGLTSSSTTAALSANQGRVLAEQIANIPTGGGGSVDSVAGKTGIVTLVKADVGLANVDNTSDASKPVSALQAAAIALKANSSALSTVATSGAYADLSGKPTLSTVAGTGAYADLTGKPAIPSAQVNSDWTAVSGVAQVLNKPTIPAAQVNSDWNASSGISAILNKPTIATVATTGSYADLANKPTYTVLATMPGSLAGYVDGSEIVITG